MIRLRRSSERGRASHGWLESRHTFSFADYHDPRHMGFRALRVINEDWVQPGQGFATHSHRDMEIVTCVLEGALQHRDSMGNGSVIRPGEVQLMRAGTGVTHSEYNHSHEDLVHLLQIWILPDRPGLRPAYAQGEFPASERRGRLRVVVSPDGAQGSLEIHQDARIYASLLDAGSSLEAALDPSRHAWIQLARGSMNVNGQRVEAGDGVAVSGESSLRFEAGPDSEFLLFDLA